MEDVGTNLEDIQQQNDDLKAQEAARMQQLQEHAQQVKQRLQDITAAAIGTRGQIAQLEDVLADQTRERYQLEGMMQTLAAQIPR